MKKVAILTLIISLFLVGCGGKEEVKLPEVSETALELTKDMLMQDSLVKDVFIEAKDGKITISIQVNHATNKEKAKDLADNGTRFLASMVDGLSGPTKDSYGELYEYYDLRLIVGGDADNVIAQGAKSKLSPNIRWAK